MILFGLKKNNRESGRQFHCLKHQETLSEANLSSHLCKAKAQK